MTADVPEQLWLMESFLNSLDVESGEDDLDSPQRFQRWLHDHGQRGWLHDHGQRGWLHDHGQRGWLHDHGQPYDDGAYSGAAGGAADVTGEELRLARELRGELRELVASHAAAAAESGTGGDGTTARLDELAARVPLRARVDGGRVGLMPAGKGVAGFLGEVLAAAVLAGHDGTWRRLKLCREGTCQAVFYDRSKNASRCWCSMQVCGNRSKTRTYRRRRTAAS